MLQMLHFLLLGEIAEKAVEARLRFVEVARAHCGAGDDGISFDFLSRHRFQLGY